MPRELTEHQHRFADEVRLLLPKHRPFLSRPEMLHALASVADQLDEELDDERRANDDNVPPG